MEPIGKSQGNRSTYPLKKIRFENDQLSYEVTLVKCKGLNPLSPCNVSRKYVRKQIITGFRIWPHVGT